LTEISSPIFQGKHQLVWNSTSLDAFKACPRRYQYSILQAWATGGDNIHIAFGLAYHKAIEVYHFAVASGASHDAASLAAVKQAMFMTWPDILLDSKKSRPNLVRTIVWYLEQFGQDDPAKTLILADGQPAVEVTFAFELDIEFVPGVPYVLAGHIDRIVTFMGDNYYSDLKTTQSALGEYYFKNYSPHNQMSTYSFSGKVVTNIPLKGGIIDAAQILVSGSRFQRGFVHRTPDQLAEWRDDLEYYLSLARVYAKREHWPMNDTACVLCKFQAVCALDPKVRDSVLASNFAKREVNPLEIRT
jgi:hypothetical protein